MLAASVMFVSAFFATRAFQQRVGTSQLIVASATAAAMTLISGNIEKSLVLLWAAYIGLLLGIALVDAESLRIPNALNLGVAILGGGMTIAAGGDLFVAMIGAGLIGAALFLIAQIYRLRTERSGLGMGDVKFVAAASICLSPMLAYSALIFACLSALAFVLWTSRSSGQRRSKVPFGPFLAPAFALALTAQLAAPL
jgi:leader peptidase (prepilin peptidase)/N-methyltransferase